MGRMAIWLLPLLFVYLCVHVVIGVFVIQSAFRDAMKSLPSAGANVVLYQHDTYCKIFPGIRFPLYPHPWAAVLVGIGLGLVILGLVFLLHVPVKDPMLG